MLTIVDNKNLAMPGRRRLPHQAHPNETACWLFWRNIARLPNLPRYWWWKTTSRHRRLSAPFRKCRHSGDGSRKMPGSLERLAEFQPGLILLDLMMPEMDGFQFVDHVANTKPGATIPIVVVTAKD